MITQADKAVAKTVSKQHRYATNSALIHRSINFGGRHCGSEWKYEEKIL